MAAVVRDAVESDLDIIVRINLESERFLSPMDIEALRSLREQAAYLRVAEAGAEVAAFLLALGPGAPYESENYRWFDGRFANFVYIDRIVVSQRHQGEGLGNTMYEDVFAFARERRLPRVVCEFDVEPPNPVSAAFHARFGFRELATQWVRGGKKRVSLQEALL